MATSRFVLMTLLGTAALPTPACAHSMLVDFRLSGDRMRVEVFFDDDTPAQGASVSIEDSAGKVVATGKADERGVWSCPLAAPGQYIVAATSTGHSARKSITIRAADLVERSSTTDESIGAPAGPTREEQTATPWRKVGIGLGLIALLFVSVWLARVLPVKRT